MAPERLSCMCESVIAFLRYVLQCTRIVLGIVVREEDLGNKNPSARVIVTNHVTWCDHVAVHIATGCVTPHTWELPTFLNWALGLKDLGLRQGRDMLLTSVRSHLNKSSSPVVLHPEAATTNGRVGLLRFSTWPFSIGAPVQPVALTVARPAVSDLSPSVLAAGCLVDMFWFLFVPYTTFTLKYLPVMQVEEGEGDDQFTVRVETAVATSLGIPRTCHTSADKTEHEKRYILEQTRPTMPQLSQYSGSPELQRMVRQVAEVLPYVPHDVILKDLVRSHSTDITISNILEGLVSYTPLTVPQTASATSSNGAASTSGTSTSSQASAYTQNACLDTSVPSFPRSAQERMMSFHERKARLIENARQKYIEKHQLKLAEFNC
uniref:Lipid droplet-regulating VLDL assembly factor AUP1 n=1 Tax=Timema douglasi TaxID=61478 RepID=A0A7R8Z4J1_TIMDO|nr:unnamed protein product [Timema douglasi]